MHVCIAQARFNQLCGPHRQRTANAACSIEIDADIYRANDLDLRANHSAPPRSNRLGGRQRANGAGVTSVHAYLSLLNCALHVARDCRGRLRALAMTRSVPMPRNSRANIRTGSSRAASVTICLRKPRRPLPKPSSTSPKFDRSRTGSRGIVGMTTGRLHCRIKRYKRGLPSSGADLYNCC